MRIYQPQLAWSHDVVLRQKSREAVNADQQARSVSQKNR